MNVLMKFLPELQMLIEKIGEMKAEPVEEMPIPPEETMGALKGIA